ncbi:hypothetical protein AX16_001124 [Volvariella volvacea WC 439]|nr:hypothetical protein AX16_001124 [Volvariella volvacea WC 439]
MPFTSPLRMRSHYTPALALHDNINKSKSKSNSTHLSVPTPDWLEDDVSHWDARRNKGNHLSGSAGQYPATAPAIAPKLEESSNRRPSKHDHDRNLIPTPNPLHLLQRMVQQILLEGTITQKSTFEFYAPAAGFLGLLLAFVWTLQHPGVLECPSRSIAQTHTILAGGTTNGNGIEAGSFVLCVLRTVTILLSGIPFGLLVLRACIFVGAKCAERFATAKLKRGEVKSEVSIELSQKELFLGIFS